MTTTHSSVPSTTAASGRADYGVDAPYVPLLMVAGAVGFAVLMIVVPSNAAGWAIGAACLAASAALYLYTTRRGKLVVWQRLVDALDLRGDERALDVGCGRGMVLTRVARVLPQGHVTGVDLWSSHDQSGNAMAQTEANARREGVADRVALETADMRSLPFDDATFDLVTSNAAIHNIGDQDGRDQAVREAFRVTRPGGRLALADIRHTKRYAEVLQELGARDVRRRSAGWQGWFGGPWCATTVVTATR